MSKVVRGGDDVRGVVEGGRARIVHPKSKARDTGSMAPISHCANAEMVRWFEQHLRGAAK